MNTTQRKSGRRAGEGAAHTPGPWKIQDETHYGALGIVNKDRAIAEIFGDGQEERKANARLIAASPDLLEACKFLRAQVSQLAERYMAEEWEEWLHKCEAIKTANTAIARAEGKEQP